MLWHQSDTAEPPRLDIASSRFALSSTRWVYSTTAGQINWDVDNTGRQRHLMIETQARLSGASFDNITHADNISEWQVVGM